MGSAYASNDIIFSVAAVYAFSILLFSLYLRRYHTELWRSFAAPGIFSVVDPIYRILRAGMFGIVQSGHWNLHDWKVTAGVFLLRGLLVVLMILIIFFSHG